MVTTQMISINKSVCDFSTNGNILVTYVNNQRILLIKLFLPVVYVYQYIYNIETKKFGIGKEVIHSGISSVSALCFSNDGTVLAISCSKGVVLVKTKHLLEPIISVCVYFTLVIYRTINLSFNMKSKVPF